MTSLPSQTICLGFVGLSATGWAAASLAPPLFSKPLSSKYSLVAVSTTNPQSAQASAEKYSELASKAAGTQIAVKPYHGSAERIASDEDVDMVAVSVKVTNHKEAAMKVIEAGKDLFIEFPAGRRLAETRELYEAASKRGIKSMVGLQTRFAHFAFKVKSIIDSGELGNVLSSSLSFSPGGIGGLTINESYKYILDSSNGATLFDISGGHFIDLFTHILGPVSSLYAVFQNHFPSTALVDSRGNLTGQTVSNDGPTQVCVSGLTHNGAAFNLHFQSGVKESEFSWTIYGENGTLRITDSNPMKRGTFDITPEVNLNGNKVELMPESLRSQTGLAWEAYADGKLGKYADLEQALKVKEILDAIWRSAKEGKRVDL